jgi:predicted nucleotidyltransferase
MQLANGRNTVPSWLDKETNALVRDAVDLLAKRHADVIAVILYGSVARHEERSLDEPDPSDVDLLAVFDIDNPHLGLEHELAVTRTIGEARMRHLDAPREVNFMFASRTMQEWDPMFVDNVKRDGIVLYQRGPLPSALAA